MMLRPRRDGVRFLAKLPYQEQAQAEGAAAEGQPTLGPP